MGAPGADPRAERGLLFLAFAATIEDQFEFITRRWVNSALRPRGGRDPPSPIGPFARVNRSRRPGAAGVSIPRP
jgi:hypothetical protein